MMQRSVVMSCCILKVFALCLFQEFNKLADRLLLKNVKDDEQFINLIRCNLPVLADVIPSDIMPYLQSKNVIRLVVLF